MASLAERLEAARREQFVGRSQERDLFESALTAPALPFALLYVHGPGGVGKTTLLREFAHLAGQHGAAVARLDGRNLDASPDYFLAAVARQFEIPEPAQLYQRLAERPGRLVLLIDTVERLTPLEGWLQDEFLPRLPDRMLTVMAGRTPPPGRWRSDPGWQALMRVVSLKNLSPEEGRALLMRRQVPAAQHLAVLNFTHGHPLALSLAADLFSQQPEGTFNPAQAPDLIKTLLDQFVSEAPSSLHRAALEACSQVRLLNEPLLGAMLDLDDPRPLFDWLRTLSFVDAEERGLFPHDLAREALAADLRWRNPALHVALHDRARRTYMNRFRESAGREQRRVLLDYIFLHRENPVIQPLFEWQLSGSIFTDRCRPEDEQAVLAMIEKFEGEGSRRLAAAWLHRSAGEVTVLRHAHGDLQGVLFMVHLERTTEAERAGDPAAAAAWSYLAANDLLAAGDAATLFRFWMGVEDYQGVSAVQSRIFLNMVQYYLTTPGLGFTLIPCADPDFWLPGFTFADLQRLPEADFTVGGRHYGVYGHNWQAVPPLRWLALMAEREVGGGPAGADESPGAPPALAEADFGHAVWDALRDFTDPAALQGNRLVGQSRLFEVAAPAAERVERLKELLQAAAAPLKEHPRQVSWYRALHHTYFQPAGTQEAAAELLDLPFSTYRRHLKSAIDYVARQLWLWENGG